MTQFYVRKRGEPVEAVQFFTGKTQHPGVRHESDDRAYVTTIHGQRAYLAEGDWILPEPDGVHYYPCKGDVFEKTYEPASASESTPIAVDDPSILRDSLQVIALDVETAWARGTNLVMYWLGQRSGSTALALTLVARARGTYVTFGAQRATRDYDLRGARAVSPRELADFAWTPGSVVVFDNLLEQYVSHALVAERVGCRVLCIGHFDIDAVPAARRNEITRRATWEMDPDLLDHLDDAYDRNARLACLHFGVLKPRPGHPEDAAHCDAELKRLGITS